MGYGFKAAAGGGSDLNFSVKNYASEEALLADAPKENTIGVVTDVPISRWIFSAENPYPMENGAVWFFTGTSSPVEFNALKKNDIQVYPISAKQYIDGVLVDVTAKSYQGGEWVDFIPEGMLYTKGNECTHTTGGWSEFVGYGGGDYHIGIFTKTDRSIVMRFNGKSTCVSCGPENKIDLRNVSKISVNLLESPTGLYIIATPVRDSNSVNKAVAKISVSGKGSHALDVSSLKDSYFVVLSIQNYASSTDFVEFDEVRLI